MKQAPYQKAPLDKYLAVRPIPQGAHKLKTYNENRRIAREHRNRDEQDPLAGPGGYGLFGSMLPPRQFRKPRLP